MMRLGRGSVHTWELFLDECDSPIFLSPIRNISQVESDRWEYATRQIMIFSPLFWVLFSPISGYANVARCSDEPANTSLYYLMPFQPCIATLPHKKRGGSPLRYSIMNWLPIKACLAFKLNPPCPVIQHRCKGRLISNLPLNPNIKIDNKTRQISVLALTSQHVQVSIPSAILLLSASPSPLKKKR